MITILSFVSAGLLSRDAADACASGPLFLQSRLHPCAEELLRMRPDAGTMDDLYETCEGYDELNAAIASRVVGADGCAYAMLGTLSEPQLAAIREAAEKRGVSVRVIPGPPLSAAAFAGEPSAHVHAAHALPDTFDAGFPCAVEEVDSALIANSIYFHAASLSAQSRPMNSMLHPQKVPGAVLYGGTARPILPA